MRQDLVDRADALTREKIAPRAAMYDREGKNPVESWSDLQREGYLACAVPTAYGGMGLDMASYIGVIRVIARGCASTAMTLHMHSTVMRFIDALGTEAQKRRYFAEVVERGKMFGSWGSEPAVSLSRTFTMETVVRGGGRLGRGRRQALLHHGARCLVLHGLVRPRRQR
jgi:butyryl-CoA dehydrogenase/acyl-CoA dehydrogenase